MRECTHVELLGRTTFVFRNTFNPSGFERSQSPNAGIEAGEESQNSIALSDGFNARDALVFAGHAIPRSGRLDRVRIDLCLLLDVAGALHGMDGPIQGRIRDNEVRGKS